MGEFYYFILEWMSVFIHKSDRNSGGQGKDNVPSVYRQVSVSGRSISQGLGGKGDMVKMHIHYLIYISLCINKGKSLPHGGPFSRAMSRREDTSPQGTVLITNYTKAAFSAKWHSN